jgi:hypothetical protein
MLGDWVTLPLDMDFKFLVADGFHVQATVRSFQDAEKLDVLQLLLLMVEFVEADLLMEHGWKSAIKSCIMEFLC